MAGLGWQELIIVLIIIMVIFGAGKLPQVAKSLGQGIKEFRQEANPDAAVEPSAHSFARTGTAPTEVASSDTSVKPGAHKSLDPSIRTDANISGTRSEAI